ncbi:MAG: PqqD family protein [Anaerolineales bacterium]|nr:PqqD family protein [Anaerolineales bacterium]
MLSDETVIVAVDDQTSVDLDDEAAILHLKTGIYFGLNEVSAFVWRRLQQPSTVSALRAALSAEYDVPPGQAADDLQRLLSDLQTHHLIEIRGASADASST